MNSGMSYEGQMDPWSAGQWPTDSEYEEVEVQAEAVVLEQSSRFDIKTIFWRYIASGTPNTPPAVLDVLALDERVSIRKRVAENPAASPKTLEKLSSDPAQDVRLGVAKNRRTPVHVLRKLSTDIAVDIRYAIAANPEVPDAILLGMFMDPSPYVADRASQTLAA
jgi:hypothetical protein